MIHGWLEGDVMTIALRDMQRDIEEVADTLAVHVPATAADIAILLREMMALLANGVGPLDVQVALRSAGEDR